MSGGSSSKSSARYCAVKSCSNNSFTCKLTFFPFPKDPETCKQWLKVAERDDLTNKTPKILNKNFTICSKHFEISQFSNKKVRTKLISNAIPTLISKRNQMKSNFADIEINLNPIVVLEDCVKSQKRKLEYSKPCPKSRKIIKPNPQHDTRFISPKEMEVDECAAISCLNSKSKYRNLSFFPFPRDSQRCMIWAKNSGRDDLFDKSSDDLHKSTALCAAHFESDQFYNPPNKKRLRWGAIPTLFKPTTGKTKILPTKPTPTPPPTHAQTSPPNPPPQTSTPTPKSVEKNRKRKRNPSKTVEKQPNDDTNLHPIAKYLPETTLTLLKIHLTRMRKDNAWTDSGRRLAAVLYVHFGPRYSALTKHFKLPSLKTIEKWLRKQDFGPGIHTHHIRILHDPDIFDRCRDSNTKMEKKSTIVVMRRVKLKPLLTYDTHSDRIDGLQDLEFVGKTRYVATHALIFTIKGLVTKWRLPVGYYPISKWISIPLLAKILFETLQQMENTGLYVRVLVLAYTAQAQQLMEYFAVSLTRPFIYFMGHRILVIYDPPSLLKRLFYSFKTCDVHFGEKNVASWRQIENLVRVDSALKLPLVPEITAKHIETVEYSHVTTKMATQVFDVRVAACLGDKDQDAASTACFLQMVAELYRHFCSKLSDESSAYPEQLMQLLAKMKNLYYVKGREPKACLRAWHLSISALGQLWHDLSAQMRKKMDVKVLRLKDVGFSETVAKMGDGGELTANAVRLMLSELSTKTLMKPTKLKSLKLEAVFFSKVVRKLSGMTRIVSKSVGKKFIHDDVEFPRQNGLSVVAGFLVKSVLERHSCDICRHYWIRKCRLSNGAIELFVLWLEKVNGVAFTDEYVVVPSEKLMDLMSKFENFFTTRFVNIIHMDRPGSRLAVALTEAFRADLSDMCAPVRRIFLKVFIKCQIKRILTIHNTKTRKRNKRLVRRDFLL